MDSCLRHCKIDYSSTHSLASLNHSIWKMDITIKKYFRQGSLTVQNNFIFTENDRHLLTADVKHPLPQLCVITIKSHIKEML